MIFGVKDNGESSDVSSHILGILFGYLMRFFDDFYPNIKKIKGSYVLKIVLFICLLIVKMLWFVIWYGGDQEEIAAEFNMGCNYYI